LVLLDEPSLRVKLMPPNESTAARTDDGALFLEFSRTFNGLPLREFPYMLRNFRPKHSS
jgi:hypothetical protein